MEFEEETAMIVEEFKTKMLFRLQELKESNHIEDDREVLLNMFDSLDTNETGCLTRTDFKKVLKILKLFYRQEKILLSNCF